MDVGGGDINPLRFGIAKTFLRGVREPWVRRDARELIPSGSPGLEDLKGVKDLGRVRGENGKTPRAHSVPALRTEHCGDTAGYSIFLCLPGLPNLTNLLFPYST